MPDIMETIKGRRSIRNYEDREVPEELLGQVLEAARWAQSWANTQCWELVVIRDPEVKKRVQETVPEGNPAIRCIVSAPVLLALCARRGTSGFFNGTAATKFGDWFMYDLGILTQNIALAAHASGLASVVLGLFDQDAARKALCVPEGYEVVSLMPLGYPDDAGRPPKRRETGEFCHWDGF